MSHVIVHDQVIRARTRLGRIAQVEALPPQLDRHEGDHWQFGRNQLVRGNYRQQIRPDEITLGEQISYTFPAPEIISPPTDGAPAGVPARPSRAAGSVAGATDQRTFFLSRSVSTPIAVIDHFAAVSSPTIPWPWVIEGIRVWDDSGFHQASFWNISTSDEDATGTYNTTRPSGAVLIDTNFTDPVGNTVDPDASIIGPPSGNQVSPMILTYPCGAAVFEAGKRLTVIWNVVTDGADVGLYCVVTVRPTAQATAAAPPPRIIVGTQPRSPAPTPAAPRAPGAAAAAAACSAAYIWINHGAGYSVQFSSAPGSAWITQAQDMLRASPTLCAGEVQAINDEVSRLLRNFGGSTGLIPIQIAPLISFYQFALQPQARRPTTLTIRAAVISLSSTQVSELSRASGLNENYLWSLTDAARVQLATRWGIL